MLRSLPAALLLLPLAARVAHADDTQPLHGPWVGVSLMRGSGFDTTVRDDSGVGLGVRGGYDFQALVGAYVAAELLTGREDFFITSWGGGLRVLTPTSPFRAGFSAGVRFNR
ncbi:hypothetical protein [Corallococcus aberystwythensis]|uniref:Outer membrane protein beta-barrel domain-containing protein n=1 Tax=Corallococcus aberystwythensis TaxID=2316722 RepID=A0A3A8PAF7_9BACT|nr:hypothetical protein [Corallococcus aberystwythensis]RKH53467.1 hypothetical protein D7W81_39160 [Corallococcus aberystwythensis]